MKKSYRTFPSFPADLEAEFRLQYTKEQAPVAWIGTLIGLIFYMAFYFWDRVVDPLAAPTTLLIRIAVSCTLATILLIPKYIFERYMQLILISAICVGGIGIVAIIYVLPNGLNVGLSGVILVLLFNFGFLRLLFVPSVITGLVVLLSYNVAALYGGLPTKLLVANNFFVVAALVAGGSITYLLESLFRSNFLRNKEIELQRARADTLVESLLPRRIAERLKLGEQIIAESHGEATVFFSDITDFTALTKKISPNHLVEILNDIFSMLDKLTEQHGVEKIKTIGDGYMVASGVNRHTSNSAEAIAEFALDVLSQFREYANMHDMPFSIRIGISTGQVISGVIGLKKLSFDLWGETVNLASRMESQSEGGHIQVSETTYWRLREKYAFEERGQMIVKGVGEVRTFFLIGRLCR